MFDAMIGVGSSALNGYLGVGGHSDEPGQIQGMRAEQMAEYMRRQGNPTNAPWGMLGDPRMAQNVAWVPKPTVTLAEYDERRAAFGREKLG